MRAAVLALALLAAPALATAEPVAVPLAGLTCVVRPNDISFGPDLALQHPLSGLPAQPDTLRVKGTAGAANTAWACLALDALYGDGVLWADGISGQVTNKKCGALVFRANYPSGKAFVYAFCEAKFTGFHELFTLDLATQTLVLLKSVSWSGGWDAYGGAGANCHWRNPAWLPTPGDDDAHQYCQWGRGRVAIVTNANGTVTITGRVFLHGTGSHGDPSRGVPAGPLTQVGADLVWTGALPAGVLTTGFIGAGVVAQTAACVHAPNTALFSVMGLTVDAEPSDPPPPSVCEE